MRRKLMASRRCSFRLQTILTLLAVTVVSLVIVQNVLSWYGSLRHEEGKLKRFPSKAQRPHTETVEARRQHQKPRPEIPTCTLPRFRDNQHKADDHGVWCQLPEPSQQGCQMADKYFNDKKPGECDPPLEICTLKFEDQDHYLHCHKEACPSGVIFLGTFDPESGELVWGSFPTMKKMEEKFQYLVESRDPSVEGGIAFIKCKANDTSAAVEEDVDADQLLRDSYLGVGSDYIFDRYPMEEREADPEQLLIFPNITKTVQKASNRTKPHLSFNILFVDSVSHSHFYRTLPLSVKQLRKMDKEHQQHVFNFERMQALKARTFENQQVLFSGQLTNQTHVLSTRAMFRALKKKGYNILWHEDLCWQWEWGMSRNFGFDEVKSSMRARWGALRKTMASTLVDDLGVSMASCQILHYNGVNDPFHANDICYNGRHQNWYIFEYVKQLQSLYGRAGKPYFQFIELNTGHNEDGLRIKTLDRNLRSYLEYLSTTENTLTIILSDHGNTYTEYSLKREGLVERYHPFLFVLAPRNFVKLVGPLGMKGLSTNQHRLISYLDIHLMLRYLINSSSIPLHGRLSDYDVQPRGLLDPVSSTRTCLSLPLFPNTKCICKSKSTNTTYTSSQLLLADFGLGVLNNMIQSQARSNSSGGISFTTASCKRLLGTAVEDVTETLGKNDTTKVEMKISVTPGKPFTHPEIFFFTFGIQWNQSATVKFTGYDRITMFNKYEKCADPLVDGRLCVCNLKSNRSSVDESVTLKHYPRVFNFNSEPRKVSGCLYIMERKRQAGMVLDGLNRCTNISIDFQLNVSSKNVMGTSQLPARYTIRENQSLFLIAFLATADNWAVHYSVNVTSTTRN